MEIIKLIVGAMATNCYVLKDNNKVIIIDPGAEFHRIKDAVGDAEVEAVLLTHGHFDHINALNEVLDHYHCDFYVSKNDFRLIKDPRLSYQTDHYITKKPILIESHKLNFDSFSFDVHFTPGHTEGSVMFEIDDHLFSGDTLFKMSIGRMDFETGSTKDMKESLKYIQTMNENLIVYPGHGENTTIKDEIYHNPYFR